MSEPSRRQFLGAAAALATLPASTSAGGADAEIETAPYPDDPGRNPPEYPIPELVSNAVVDDYLIPVRNTLVTKKASDDTFEAEMRAAAEELRAAADELERAAEL